MNILQTLVSVAFKLVAPVNLFMMHYLLYHEISSLAIRDSGLAGSEGGRKKGTFSVIFLA